MDNKGDGSSTSEISPALAEIANGMSEPCPLVVPPEPPPWLNREL